MGLNFLRGFIYEILAPFIIGYCSLLGFQENGTTGDTVPLSSTSPENESTQPSSEVDNTITIDPETSSIGEIKMLLAGKSLPTCSEKTGGATYYLVTEAIFKPDFDSFLSKTL